MAYESDCDPDVFDLINNLSELCINMNKFRNVEDFEISKTTTLYAPLCMARGIDKRKQQNVSIVSHKNYADYDLKDLLSEIKVVSKLQHPNLLKFYENSISLDEKKIGFIYESHACLLSEALDEDVQIVYRPEVIKRIMKELFSALDYLHKNGVVHRDIQQENIILTHSGAVKVWNFWCAQTVGEPLVEMKSSDFRYQPVESILLEGTVHPSLDIWSANVIFGELWLKTFIFPIADKGFMLASIFALFGFPTKRIWEDFFNFRDAEKLQVYSAYEFNMLEVKFAHELNESIISDAAWDLLQKGFRYNPKKRLTAEECLAHPYFSEEPPQIAPWGSEVIDTISKLIDVRRAKHLIEKQIKCLNAITLM